MLTSDPRLDPVPVAFSQLTHGEREYSIMGIQNPYQMQAMTARFRTGQSVPQIPKPDLPTIGKGIW